MKLEEGGKKRSGFPTKRVGERKERKKNDNERRCRREPEATLTSNSDAAAHSRAAAQAAANSSPVSMSNERTPLVAAPASSLSTECDARGNDERAGGGGGSIARLSPSTSSTPATAASSPLPPSSPSLFPSLFSLLWNCGAACILTSTMTRSGSAAALKGMNHRVRALVVVFVRSVAALALTVFTRSRSPKLREISFFGHPRSRHLLVARGTVSGCAVVFFYAAVERLPLADALALNFLSPVILTLMSRAVHGEAPGKSGLAAAVATVAGVALVCQPEALFGGSGGGGGGSAGLGAAPEDAVAVSSSSFSSSSSQKTYRLGGIALAVLSAFCAATGFTVLRALSQRPEGPPAALTTAAYFHLCSLLVSSVPLLFEVATAIARGERLPGVGEPGAGPPHLPADIFLAAILILGGFAGQTLMNRAFLLEPAAKMAALNTAQVLYGHIFGLVFLGERENVPGAVGSALIAAGAVAAALGGKGGGGKGGSKGGTGEGSDSKATTTAADDIELASSTTATRSSSSRAAAAATAGAAPAAP